MAAGWSGRCLLDGRSLGLVLLRLERAEHLVQVLQVLAVLADDDPVAQVALAAAVEVTHVLTHDVGCDGAVGRQSLLQQRDLQLTEQLPGRGGSRSEHCGSRADGRRDLHPQKYSIRK